MLPTLVAPTTPAQRPLAWHARQANHCCATFIISLERAPDVVQAAKALRSETKGQSPVAHAHAIAPRGATRCYAWGWAGPRGGGLNETTAGLNETTAGTTETTATGATAVQYSTSTALGFLCGTVHDKMNKNAMHLHVLVLVQHCITRTCTSTVPIVPVVR